MVSAIITTHNRRDLVQRAIQSVKNQTYKDMEIIVVDDASDDGTEQILRKVEGINYIKIEKQNSRGGNHARNVGISLSKGDYIAFLDDDDEWLPTKIEKQLTAFDSEKVGMVYCDLYVDVGKRLLNYKHAFTFEGDLYSKHQYWKAICTTSAMLFKRDVFKKIGLFDEKVRYWQEYELSLRLIEKYEIRLVKEPLVHYRRGIGDQKKLTNNYDLWEESVRYIRNKHKRLFDELPESENKKYLEVYLSEAAYRASAVGLKTKMRMYYKQPIIKKVLYRISR